MSSIMTSPALETSRGAHRAGTASAHLDAARTHYLAQNNAEGFADYQDEAWATEAAQAHEAAAIAHGCAAVALR